MKIEKVYIKNIKGIKDLELSFRKDNEILDVIVLAGVNGSGKTTILESIKDFFNNRYINDNNQIIDLNIFLENSEKILFEEFQKEDIYKNKFSSFFHRLSVLNSENTLNNKTQGEDIYKNKFSSFFHRLSVLNSKNTLNNKTQGENLPKIVYVPANNSFEKVETETSTLSIGYEFTNIINLDMMRDIPSYTATRRNHLATIEEDLTMKEITNKVVNEINSIFDILELDVKLKGFSKDEKTMPIFENSAGEEFDINDLSSGEKQLFLRTLSIKMLEPKNSIILIDEPELSLHPKWQQRIIEVYKKIGENNQIIIATHSPHILGSVSSENIFILYRDEKGKIEAKTGDELYSSYGQPVDRVLKDIMGLESIRTPKIEKDLEELRKLVDEDKYDTKEFKEKYNELLEILGNTDEDLFLIDMDAKLKQKVNSNAESK